MVNPTISCSHIKYCDLFTNLFLKLLISSFKLSEFNCDILAKVELFIIQLTVLLKKIYNSLESGGAFISVEKIRSSNSHYEDILNQMYFDFKLDQNLSEKEILNKAKSLRSSMYLFNEKESKKLLTEAGFKDSEVFFKCFNFVGYISIK